MPRVSPTPDYGPLPSIQYLPAASYQSATIDVTRLNLSIAAMLAPDAYREPIPPVRTLSLFV